MNYYRDNLSSEHSTDLGLAIYFCNICYNFWLGLLFWYNSKYEVCKSMFSSGVLSINLGYYWLEDVWNFEFDDFLGYIKIYIQIFKINEPLLKDNYSWEDSCISISIFPFFSPLDCGNDYIHSPLSLYLIQVNRNLLDKDQLFFLFHMALLFVFHIVIKNKKS